MFLANAQVPGDTNALRQKIITDIVPNGTKQITASQMRDILLAITNLMKSYALDSAYYSSDTLYLTRRGGYTTLKIHIPGSGTAAETDPTVSNAAKTITQANIDAWNNKQNLLVEGAGIDINGNLITAESGSALWNSSKLQGRDVATLAPVFGDCLVWNGSKWTPGPCNGTPPVDPLIITSDPQSVVVSPNTSVTLAVSATGGVPPLTFQWRLYGVDISGANSATYTFTAASEGQYDVIVTDAINNKDTSDFANVSFPPQATVRYTSVTFDPYNDINNGMDNLFSYTSFTITQGADISVPFNSSANNKYWMIKVPESEPVKESWFNTALNSGTIPDQVWYAPLVKNGFRYYITRIAATLDTSSPVILKD